MNTNKKKLKIVKVTSVSAKGLAALLDAGYTVILTGGTK